MAIRVIVVDDEHLARRRLRTLLRSYKDFSVIGECANGADALEMIPDMTPDVVFLDVQMPELSGLDVAGALLEHESPPLVVFVTAFEDYALSAFRVGAAQYLVKPVDRKEFARAAARVRQLVTPAGRETSRAGLQDLVARFERRDDSRKLIAVRDNDRTVIVRINDVDWFEAAGNYVRLHVGERSYLIRETIDRIASQLDRLRFGRIHRSTIVNFDRIAELHADSHGDYIVVLRNGKELPLSRSFRDRVPLLLGRL